MSKETLPNWAKKDQSGLIIVDPDLAYPQICAKLVELGTACAGRIKHGQATDKKFRPEPEDVAAAHFAQWHDMEIKTGVLDQYAVEVIYQCVKLELQRILARFDFTIVILNRPIAVLANHEEGKGARAAGEGKDARRIYKRWRGFLPA